MGKFSENNTEGFTPEQLLVLNEALEQLLEIDGDEKRWFDRLTNCWVQNDSENTVEKLVTRAQR
jgi:hypothetical protein